MNKRKPSDVWPSRRRANRIVLASFVVAAVLQLSFQYLGNTFLLVEGWPLTAAVATMLVSGVVIFAWVIVVLWAGWRGEFMAFLVVLILIGYMIISLYGFSIFMPLEKIDEAHTQGKNFYLVQVDQSQFNPSPDGMWPRELIACEGNSRRLRDCELLWSESVWGSASNNYATSYWEDTYLELDNETGIMRVIAGYETASLLQQKMFVSTDVLYEYQPE
ncbi:MAG: hypothetical protein AAF787_15240 [Chloroflexota bacterium]